MVTPFDAEGEVDLDSARRVARYVAESGSHGVVVAGTTGESPTLSDDEKLALLEAVKDEAGDRLTVVCGTGSNDTRHSAQLTRRAAEAGADAVLVVTPYYNKPNPAGVRAHFETVAEAAGTTPVILYNIPSRTVINVGPDVARPARGRRGEHRGRQTGERRRPRPDRRPRRAGGQRQRLPAMPGGRWGRRDPRLLASRRAGDAADLRIGTSPATPRTPRSSTRSCDRSTRRRRSPRTPSP